MSDTLNTHGVTMEFGKHRDKLITRVPVSYLVWMVNENTPQADYAAAELERRGAEMPSVHISGHAIDRASLRVHSIWRDTREKDEGLHSWLCRMVHEALTASGGEDGRIRYKGMKLVVEMGEEFPVLKTIMLDGKGRKK